MYSCQQGCRGLEFPNLNQPIDEPLEVNKIWFRSSKAVIAFIPPRVLSFTFFHLLSKCKENKFNLLRLVHGRSFISVTLITEVN